MIKHLVIMLLFVFALSCAGKKAEVSKHLDLSKKAADIEKKVAQYENFNVNVDISFLTKTEKEVLMKLVEASKYIDQIYFRQAYSKNPQLKATLSKSKDLNKKYLEYFEINYGPFDRLDDHKPFIGGEERPKGANFYPSDITKEEFNNWISKHPDDAKSFKGLFSVIKREGDKLVAIPYSKEYAKWLKPAAKLMKEAADITKNKSLAKFLRSRADSFFSDDYYQSDID